VTATVQLEIETGTLPRRGGPHLRTYTVTARVAGGDTSRAEGTGTSRCIRQATAQALRELARVVENNERWKRRR